MPRLTMTAILAVTLVAACSGSTGMSTIPSVEPTAAPTATTQPTPPSTPAASASPQADHPLIGEWMGEHRCERIVEILTAAKLENAILENIVGNGLLPGVSSVDQIADPTDPCAGAIVVPHSHAFTSDGLFASYDGSHQRVDDGVLAIVDEDTFLINQVPFTYEIDGDSLTITPDDPTQWATMVAMPGLVWRRVPD